MKDYKLLKLNRWPDDERASSSRREDIECTEPTGSPVNNSPPADDGRSGTPDSTRDSTGRSDTDEGSSLYRGLAGERLDFRFGGPRPDVSGRNNKHIARFQDHCDKLHLSIRSFFPAVRGLEELEILDTKRAVDWPFDKPCTVEDWKQFFYFFFEGAKYMNIL